jgi:hypothetical protein
LSAGLDATTTVSTSTTLAAVAFVLIATTAPAFGREIGDAE